MLFFSMGMDQFCPKADYILPTPYNVTASTDQSNRIEITWESVCGNGSADHFLVYAKEEGSSTYHSVGKVSYDGCAYGEAFDYDFVMDGIVDFAYRDYSIKVKTCPDDGYYCSNDYFSEVVTGSAVIDPPFISATDGTFANKIEISFFEYSFNSQAYRVHRSASPEGPYTYVGYTYGDAVMDGTYIDYVSPGTTYYYKGEICTLHNDCSPLSTNYAIGFSSSTGPSGISATDGTVAQHIDITWDENPNANGYRVYRSETSTPPADPLDYLPPEVYTTDYQDSGADPYTTYYYWIRAYDTSLGTGDWTPLSASDTGWRTYKSVYNFSASDGTSTDHVDITWGNFDDAFINQYIIYRSITSDGEKINLGHSSTTSFTDNLASPGHTYYYWVKSCDELNRCSNLSSADSGYATLSTVGTAGALTASDGTSTDHVLLEWDPVYGADYYKLYRGQTSGSRPANNFTTSTSPTYTDTSATPGVQYYYWVQACTTETCSAADATDGGYRALSGPTNVQASDGTDTAQVQITWDSASGADFYELYSASTLGGVKNLVSSPIAGTSFADSSMAEGQALYYWVKACTALTCSDFSSPDLGWRGIMPPANLSASDGEYNQVSLSWDSNPSASHYAVYRSESSDGTKSLLTSNNASTSYNDTTATPGTTYYYWVKAFISTYDSDFSPSDTGWARGGTLPVVSSITRVDSNPTNAASVQFLVTFNKDVTGVTPADFVIDSSGLTGAALSGITGTGNTRTVTVLTGTGSGTLSIDVVDDNSILDDITNQLGGPTLGDGDFTSGEAYTIDKEAPTLVSFTRYNPVGEDTNADTLVFQADFSEAVNNVTSDDFNVNSASSATISDVQQVIGDTYRITVSGGDLADFNGTVNLDLSGTQNITDLIGNPLPQTEPATDEGYSVDNKGPEITSIIRSRPTDEYTNATTLNLVVYFDSPVYDVTDLDFEVIGGSTAQILGSATASPTEVIGLVVGAGDIATFNGELSIGLTAAQYIVDAAGNPLSSEDPDIHEYYILDHVAPTTVSIVGVAPEGTKVFITKPTELEVNFSEDVKHDGSLTSADYPGNYRLFSAGENGVYDTTSCFVENSPETTLGNDDVVYAVGPIDYSNGSGSGPYIATLTINNGTPLPIGKYRLMVCGTTSIEDLAGNEIYDGESDPYVNLNVVVPAALPETGFTPGVVSDLPAKLSEGQYDASAGFRLSIPKLGTSRVLKGIPASGNGWNLTWLGNDLGYLAGTAYPTWPGNTVITGHAYNNYGLPGPLNNLDTLRWGDQIIISSDGQEYVYEVRSVSEFTSPDDISTLQRHEAYDWVTLITCNSYDQNVDAFLFRTVVRAILVDVR
jgi:LPXTG-site transpeptidase (sortase) family protein